MKCIRMLLLLCLLPMVGYGQVPTNEEAFEQLQSFFPATIGLPLLPKYPRSSVANNTELAGFLKKLVDGKIITMMPVTGTDDIATTLTRTGKFYYMPTVSNNDVTLLSGAFLLLEEVTQVMPHPDRDYTYIVSAKVKVQELAHFGKKGIALGDNDIKIEVTATSNGWRPAPGGNATSFIEKAEESGFGAKAIKNYDFFNRMPEIVTGTWLATSKNVKKQNAFHFDPETMTYWYYNAKLQDTLKGKYRPSVRKAPSQTTYFREYRLTPRSGKLINLTVEKVDEATVKMGDRGKLGSQKFRSADADVTASATATAEVAALQNEVLPGHWENKKGYYITFNEDGTAECYLAKKHVNFGRKKDDKIEDDIVEWSGKYWIMAPAGKKLFAVVFGEEGNMDAVEYIWVYQSPQQLLDLEEKYLSAGLSQFFKR